MNLFPDPADESARSELMTYQPSPYNNLDLNEFLSNADLEAIKNGKFSIKVRPSKFRNSRVNFSFQNEVLADESNNVCGGCFIVYHKCIELLFFIPLYISLNRN